MYEDDPVHGKRYKLKQLTKDLLAIKYNYEEKRSWTDGLYLENHSSSVIPERYSND